MSHFGLEQPRLLERLSARRVRSVALVHDLIPITHPEYCSAPALGMACSPDRRRSSITPTWSSPIPGPRRRSLLTLLFKRRDIDRPGPAWPRLVWSLPSWSRPTAIASHRPYFVCIGTLEPRKNLGPPVHAVGRRLARRMGEATPSLVLAGRRGWETETIIDHLDRAPAVRRFVHEVSGLGDVQLARLIAGANALLAPSFSEGFDLPVAEATALGTPVIASDIPVHREFSRHAQLLDPIDGPAWLAAIEAAARRRPPSPAAIASSWPEHFDIVENALGF